VFTCFAGLALEPLGPRTTAMSGLVLEIFGNIIVCTAKKVCCAALYKIALKVEYITRLCFLIGRELLLSFFL